MKKILFVLSVALAVTGALAVPVVGAQETAQPKAKTGAGALIGGLLGAAAGGVIGHDSGHTTEGVLIGGAAGALGGAAVGSQMKTDPSAKTASPTTSVISGVDSAKVTMKQVIYWTEQGLPSDEIISRIETSKTTFVLTADDVAYLQKKGVSQMVIEAMQGQ